MASDLMAASAAARRIFEIADAACDRPISRICVEGPEEALRATDVAQPALVAHALAALAALAEAAGLGCEPVDAVAALGTRWTAGHSLGEYAAGVAAGALSVQDGLCLAAERGRLMAAAPAGAMAAVLGLDAEQIQGLTSRIAGIAVVANDNAPGQVVISGEPAAVAALGSAAQVAGARRVLPLNVGGAFHSPLMAEAAERFGRTLAATAIAEPRLPVIGNVSAAPIRTAAELRAELTVQIASPVRWRESVLCLAQAGAERAIECGPGNVLAGLGKRIAPALPVLTLGTWNEVETLAAELRS
jgi:[acyl-carrier-protein] S-malonyltransferase